VAVFYFLVVVVCTSPIWLSGYFMNQDGAAHANNAWMMSGLTAGDAHFTDIYQFNSFAIPNSIGHWMLAGLLLVFSPYAATKIMVVGIFAASVVAAGFLRYKAVGQNGLRTSILIGAAVTMNWLWLIGLYNFYIGLVIVVFAIGLFHGWREDLTLRRTAALALIFLIAYFSHLIPVMALASAVFVLALSSPRESRVTTVIRSVAAMVPILPLAIIYRSLSVASEVRVVPTWLSLSNIWSPVDWFNQIRKADPFIMISRQAFPFVESLSSIFLVFTPVVWMFVALTVLGLLTFYSRNEADEKTPSRLAYIFLFAAFLVFALFGPDHFGSEHGGILRQRVLILSLLLFIPIFRVARDGLLKRTAQAILVFVIAFQTLALAEYSAYSDTVSREFVSAQSSLPDTGGLASITVIGKPPRHQPIPEITIDNLHGIGTNVIVWDNYELGYYLFPVVAKRPTDKDFVYSFTQNSTLFTEDPGTAAKLVVLDQLLTDSRIDTLMVWGGFQELDLMLQKHFEAEAYYRSENIRLFKRRTITDEPERR
jgi:hypothetical protein